MQSPSDIDLPARNLPSSDLSSSQPSATHKPLGLSGDEAQRRLQQFGPNALPEPAQAGPVRIFLQQFLSPFIYILLIAAVVSLLLNQLANAVFIFAVLILNAVIGTIQEYSAQRAAAALRNMVRGHTHVIRDGRVQEISIDQLVPGDWVQMASGDKVPADIQLQVTQDLTIDESMLTGESMAVTKNSAAQVAADAPLADRVNQCFAGTIIVRGRAQGEVIATAMGTQIGKIADQVTAAKTAEPPLMIRIRRFTYQVAGAIVVAILLLVGMMLIRGGYNTEGMAMMAIGLAVSTIPEGLPAALTVALAIGMRRMAKHNVVIRKLVAVEALGSCTFICSDKTGTLTVNEMTVREVVLPDGRALEVTGEGVAPGGEVLGQVKDVQELCITGLLANESDLDYAGGEWSFSGDIVDVAFLVLAKKLGLSLSKTRDEWQQQKLIPYESERAFSGSVNHNGGESTLHVKGSPEKLLAMCTQMRLGDQVVAIDREAIENQFNQLAAKGYRVLALAYRDVSDSGDTDDSSEELRMEQMVFLGMVGMMDPLRGEAYDAVQKCFAGGIEVAMVTGDHPATAKAISVELGLCSPDDQAVTGPMIREANQVGEAHADQLIRGARVFARIEPKQKEQIVSSFMRAGHFVAVTGDGVNDAPAMRHANAGVAMGKRGTDVAKETASLIITDDNFSSIVDGIEQGRIVYNNIRKVIALLVATGFSALLLFFLTVLTGLPMPMTAVQLLWLNLIANGLQDVALAFEPKEGGELDEAPRKPSEPIFERHILEHVLVTGTTMGGLAFIVYAFLMNSGMEVENARNLTLMLMVLFGNIHALCSRSETRSIFQIPLFSNPFLMLAIPLAQLIHIGATYTPGISHILQLQPISLSHWLILAAIASLLLLVEEIHKYIKRKQRKHPPNSTGASTGFLNGAKSAAVAAVPSNEAR